MKTVWGISANSHDAGLAVLKHGFKGLTDKPNLTLLFASHSERFSKIKNDPHLSQDMVDYALEKFGYPREIVWYEKPFKKTLRQYFAGQGWNSNENNIKEYLNRYGIDAPISYVDHHRSHAAGGFYTSPYRDATVVVIDAIGEFATTTIWQAEGTSLTKRFTKRFPHSLGLFYSAMTQRVGLTPNEDEYILMGMAAYGNPNRLYYEMHNDFFKDKSKVFALTQNLHRGCKGWRPDLTTEQDMYDIAAATQKIYEMYFAEILIKAKYTLPSNNLVISGGCALNCSANAKALNHYDNVWIMPNPGDAGSALGSVLAKHNMHIKWNGPYLGYNIPGPYPVKEIIDELLKTGICGVANGPAEYGPRALGNRSLLADPRRADIKDKVNKIKRRQRFRPFAPAVLSEYTQDLFSAYTGPYMQFTAPCTQVDKYPAIVHVDGTSRVQTVGVNDNPGFRLLLEEWHKQTGCPMLLNTSLNIKGQPIVNNLTDAEKFATMYNVKVY